MKLQLATLFLALLVVQPILAQESGAEEDNGSQSGYDDLPEFGGPESVGNELQSADRQVDERRHLEGPAHEGQGAVLAVLDGPVLHGEAAVPAPSDWHTFFSNVYRPGGHAWAYATL